MDLWPMQVRAARAWLGLGVRELGALADVAPLTISRFETGNGRATRASSHAALARVRAALEAEGVTFLAGDGEEAPGITVKRDALIRVSKKSGPRASSRADRPSIGDGT